MVKLRNIVPDMMEEMLSRLPKKKKKKEEGEFFLLKASLIKWKGEGD